MDLASTSTSRVSILEVKAKCNKAAKAKAVAKESVPPIDRLMENVHSLQRPTEGNLHIGISRILQTSRSNLLLEERPTLRKWRKILTKSNLTSAQECLWLAAVPGISLKAMMVLTVRRKFLSIKDFMRFPTKDLSFLPMRRSLPKFWASRRKWTEAAKCKTFCMKMPKGELNSKKWLKALFPRRQEELTPWDQKSSPN